LKYWFDFQLTSMSKIKFKKLISYAAAGLRAA
jgi:hypothetical protein